MIEIEAEMAVSTGVIKSEPSDSECAVCGEGSTAGTLSATTATLLWRHAPLLPPTPDPKVCAPCGLLLTALERAETEYTRSKEAFEAVLVRNPLCAALVKQEPDSDSMPASPLPTVYSAHDSEDEPLAVTKQKRRPHAKRKKKTATSKKTRKPSKKNIDDDSWNMESVASKIVLELNPVLGALKQEETQESLDGSENSQSAEGDLYIKIEPQDPAALKPKPKSKAEPLKPSRGRGRPRAPRPPPKQKDAVYQCEQCPAKYTTLKRLEAHSEKHGKGPYICEVCGAAYKHKRACDVHVALHRGISDWKCIECDRLFPSRGALQRHNAIHTGTPAYQCEQCGKSFIHTSSFKMHKLAHSGLKAHACGVCGLRLMTRSHLKRHLRIHSGEKRHECTACGKRFGERYNLVAHMRAHAAMEEAAANPPPPALPAVPAAPRRRLFRCAYCTERFERRYMLERHMSSTHGRTLERQPPTPRNTMSKLLKAQALGLAAPAASNAPSDPAAPTAHSDITASTAPALPDGALKEERSPEARPPAPPPPNKYSFLLF